MVGVVNVQKEAIDTRLQPTGQVHIPFEAVIVGPPQRVTQPSYGNGLAIKVKHRLVEHTRKTQVQLALCLGRFQTHVGVVPGKAGVALIVRGDDALGLGVKVGSKRLPLTRDLLARLQAEGLRL